MYRIIGISLIVVSCSGFFWKKVQQVCVKYNNLRELKKGITHLKHELSHSACELPLIFKKVSQLLDGEVSSVFKNIGTELAKNEISDMKLLWETSGGKDLLLPESAKKVTEELIYNIGKKELETEIEKLERAIVLLEQIETEEREKTQKDKKLLCTVGASFAAAVVILFI